MTIILMAGILPLYMLFRKSGETAFRSEIAYKAIQVARAELEEIRMMPVFEDGGQPGYQGHEWQQVVGRHIFARVLGNAAAQGPLADPRLVYPPSYRGIETRVKVIPPPIQDTDSADYRNTRIVRLEVRWQMEGKANKASAGTQVYHQVVVRRGY